MNYTLQYDQDGYVALISTIVISILLLAITVSLGFSSFLGRFDIVDSESKERSLALAEACVDKTTLNIAEGINYTGTVSIGSDSCSIISVAANTPSIGKTTIKTQAIVNKSYTNLKVVIDSTDFSITSWNECPTLSSC